MKLRLCLSVLALMSLLSTPTLAQDAPPAIMLDGEGHKPMHVTAVDVQVKVDGFVAETRMTLTFSNPHNRVMGGELVFPLPENATISGYALDIHGAMVDGVVVEKDRARQIFETELRKGIDPGLAEWTQGNAFRTRVYPIPPNGTRTVMVRYLSTLTSDAEAATYLLPLNFKEPLKTFHMRVDVVRSQVVPTVKQSPLANFTFKKWEDHYVAEATLEDQAVTGTFGIALPDVPKEWAVVEQAGPDTFYFAGHPLVPAHETERKVKSHQKVTILWDASGGREAEAVKSELDFLSKFIATRKCKQMDVELVVFRHQADGPRRFVVKNNEGPALIKAIKELNYDGGTQLASISPANGWQDPDFYVLFSDGLSNIGDDLPTGFTAPVFVVSGSTVADHPLLKQIARQSGGAFYNLKSVAEVDALNEVGFAPFVLKSVKVLDGKVTDLTPSSPTPAHGRIPITGMLQSREARLLVEFGIGAEVLSSVTLTVRKADAEPGKLLRQYWAQQKISELMGRVKKNKDELVAMGRDYGLVTPGTSLLVLESLEQYVEHRVMPPESLPEMRKEWIARVEEMDAEKRSEEKDLLAHAVELWNARKEWWNRKFEIPKEPVQKGEEKAAEMEEDEARSSMGMGMGGAGSSAGGGMRSAAPREARMEASVNVSGKKSKAKDEEAAPQPTIQIQAWNPDTPYMKALDKVGKKGAFAHYLKMKKEYGNMPAYYLDCATWFFKNGLRSEGLQVLTNIVELELENPALFRVMAYKLAQEKYLKLAASVLEHVLELRPEEPQSYRDLALVLDQMDQYQRAVELLYKVVLGQWDRFDEIELIALMEMNRIIARAKRKGISKFDVDKRLVELLDLDVRISLTWDTDLTDMDLWVIEPTGEKAFYGNNLSQIGGLVSRDFTQGYGPEEYVLHHAMRGKYKIQANFYGSSAPALTGAVTLQVTVFTNFGRTNEKKQVLTLRLDDAKEVIDVGTIEF